MSGSLGYPSMMFAAFEEQGASSRKVCADIVAMSRNLDLLDPRLCHVLGAVQYQRSQCDRHRLSPVPAISLSEVLQCPAISRTNIAS